MFIQGATFIPDSRVSSFRFTKKHIGRNPRFDREGHWAEIGNISLLGGMPIKFIGNSFVMFYTKHLPL